MSAPLKLILILFVALLPIITHAQEAEPPPDNQPVTPPVTLNGQGPSLALQSEQVRSNKISGGVSFTGMFTDNAIMTSTDQISNFSALILPHLTLSQSMPRLNLDLSLSAGLIVNQNLSTQNQASENLTLNLTYRLAEHVTLRLSNYFANSTGLFSMSNLTTAGSGIGPVEQPNNSLIVPPAQQTLSNSSLAELSYQFSPKSFAGVRGGYSIVDFPNPSQNAQFGQLYNSRTYLGEAYYDYQMTARQWLGITLRAQRFDIQQSTADTTTGSLLFLYAVNATPNITLSLFAGPNYNDAPQLAGSPNLGPIPNQRWSSAEGATFNWKGVHTSVAAAFSRQISNGGGFSTPVTSQTANASLHRQLSRRQDVGIGFTYAENSPLGSGNSFNGFSGVVQFQQRLANNFTVGIGYGWQQQDLLNSQGAATANRAWFSASYDFTHPLGR